MTTPAPPSEARLLLGLAAVLTIAFGIVFLGALLLTGAIDAHSTPLLVTYGLSIPPTVGAITAAAYARNTNTAVRNGLLVEKTAEALKEPAVAEHLAKVVAAGSLQAIDSAQVLTRTGPVVTAELQALQELLSAVRSGPTVRVEEAPSAATQGDRQEDHGRDQDHRGPA